MPLPTTIDDAYNAVNPDVPLQSGDPRYVDMSEVRGGDDLARLLAERLRRSDRGEPRLFQRQLITGHRRCGKTTELFRLRHELERHGYFVVYFDAETELDIADISYLDVLLSLAQQVELQLRESPLKIELKSELLQNLKDWFAQTILTRIETRDTERVLETEYGLGLESPVAIFARMLATLKGHIKNSAQRRKEIRQELERELSAFIERLNELIDDAQARLKAKGRAGLLVIVDGLEKMLMRDVSAGFTSHEMMFIHHAEQLQSPRCHLLYTVPISLLYSRHVQQALGESEVIPMVSVYQRDGVTPHRAGRDKLVELIARRLDVDAIFADRALVGRLVEMSGGHPGDLLRLVRFAFDDSETTVRPEAVEYAIRKLVNDYDRLTHDRDLELLWQVHREKRVSGDPEFSTLLFNLLILEYNGDRWADVHPAVRATRRWKEFGARTPSKPKAARRARAKRPATRKK
ncbi:MAG: ATP-binding protein [Chloroflexi bacterium]|nr:ATP-binding protein [Chloroflexota bacterium]